MLYVAISYTPCDISYILIPVVLPSKYVWYMFIQSDPAAAYNSYYSDY